MRLLNGLLRRQPNEVRATSANDSTPNEGAALNKSVEPTSNGTRQDARLPEANAAYGYGIADGSWRVDPQYFFGYLRETVEQEGIERQMETLHDRGTRLKEQEQNVVELRRKRSARLVELRHAESGMKTAEQEVQSLDGELEDLRRTGQEARGRGSLLSALLYGGIAGSVFILGEVVMSRHTVADALGLTGQKIGPIDESWIFALSLAMLSVLLKIFYDRVIETPWLAGKVKPFTWTVGICCSLAILTLAILGRYRSEALASFSRVETTMGNEGIPLAQRMETIQAIQEALFGSPWGQLSFLLTGVLFAVAGAICLTIGLRHAQDFYHLHLKRALRGARAAWRKRAAKKRLQAWRAQVQGQERELAELEAVLHDGPDLEHIRSTRTSLDEEHRSLLEQGVRCRTDQLQNLYRDGYSIGVLRQGEQASRPVNHVRPHVAVRQAIRGSLSSN